MASDEIEAIRARWAGVRHDMDDTGGDSWWRGDAELAAVTGLSDDGHSLALLAPADVHTLLAALDEARREYSEVVDGFERMTVVCSEVERGRDEAERRAVRVLVDSLNEAQSECVRVAKAGREGVDDFSYQDGWKDAAYLLAERISLLLCIAVRRERRDNESSC